MIYKKGLDIEGMRTAVRDGRIEWERHALERMARRAIRRADVQRILSGGELIEEYPDDRPFPSALFLGWIKSRPLHVVAAFNSHDGTAFIITAYEPDLEYFESNFRTRRKR